MTISVVVTETEINASVTQLSNSVALTETEINASVSQTPISANVTSSPVSASVTAGTSISVTVSQNTISASITSNGGGGGVTNHALLTNLDYASAGHTGFQATLTADVDYLTPATAALTYQPIGSYLTDAPSDGTTYGRNNGAWIEISAGITDHASLSNLDYASAGHTGFQAALSFPLTPDLGGTGIANLAGSTLTLGGATTISTGGTIALGGYTLTVPATGTAALLAVDNTFTGSNLFTRGTAASNTFVGGGGNATATGVNNTAIGGIAGASITTGAGNFALGYNALNKLTEGSGNVAIGESALAKTTTGTYNMAIGFQSLISNVTGSGNVAIGYGTGKALLGSGCVFIGYAAGFSTTGANNTIIGYASGFSQTTGIGNIYIGYAAGRRQVGTSNLLIIDSTQRADAATEAQNAYLYGSMAAGGYLQLNIPTTTNNAVKDTLKLQAYVSTASTGAANGFGVGLPFLAETATDGTYQQQGLISTSWIDATNATRKAKMSLSAYDTAARLGLEIEADGSAAKLGFYGVTTVARQVLATGAGASADDIITALQNLGLVKQS